MTVSLIPARVVESLQAIIASTVPGSLEHDAAEYAIKYALSPRRIPSNEAFFLQDVRRDARKSVLRLRKRESKLFDRICGELSPSARLNEVGILAYCKNFAGHGVTYNCTPEDEWLAKELEGRIRGRVSRLGSKASRCFDGMLLDESPRQTAEALNVSVRTVNRYHRAIREVTLKILEEDNAVQ